MSSRSTSKPRSSLAEVVGLNCKAIRSKYGVTQNDLAKYAREVGLRWDAAKVGRFEAGAVAPTFSTVLAVSLALSKALAGQNCSVRLADLVAFDGNVTLTADGPDPLGDAVAEVCRGLPWRLDPETLYGTDELAMARVSSAITAAAMAIIRDEQEDALAHAGGRVLARRSGVAEDRVGKRLKVDRDELADMSFRLWRATFSEERDRRAGPDANAQKRGRVSRELTAELKRALADGND